MEIKRYYNNGFKVKAHFISDLTPEEENMVLEQEREAKRLETYKDFMLECGYEN